MNLIQISNVSIRQHNGLYSLNDLHRAAGGENRHKPSLWTSNQQTIELIKEVEKAGNPAILSKQGLGTFVCKELVIHYGMWISPSFSLQVIRTFLAVQEQGSLKSQTTTDQRTPLRQAVSALVGARGIDYSTAYKMVHQRFNVEAIEAIPAEQIPLAVEYVHRLTLNGEVLDKQPEKTEITFSQRELRELATVTYYCAWSNNILRELAVPLSDLGYAKASTLRTLPTESRFFLRNVHKALLREMPKIASAFERDCMQNSLMRCELFI
ncbi:KilA-N domain-containing protein [Kingella oralis]|uniref:KilA-N domain-containing protein n=1 Tax=Kingella oralis TaxID=505 RepID=UPI0034E5E143